MICVHGKCTIELDDGFDKQTVDLDSPSEGLLVTNCVWREMYNFENDAVLLVLASDHYKEDDYIRSYDSFIEYINNIGGQL